MAGQPGAGRVPAGPVEVPPAGCVSGAVQAQILAGGVGCQHGADCRVVDRAVAGGRAGPVSVMTGWLGVSRRYPDISGCMFMSWLVTVAPVAPSTRRGSTRPL